MTGEELHRIIKSYRSASDHVYAVADAARDRSLAFGGKHEPAGARRWLFEDGTAEHMKNVAPYLFPIEFRDRYPFKGSVELDRWADRLGHNAGILLLAPSDPESLYLHLRSVFLAEDETGHKYFFRFYDPRVLRDYLPTCNRADADVLFGPIDRILLETESGRRVVACRADRRGVKIDERPIPAERKGVRDAGHS